MKQYTIRCRHLEDGRQQVVNFDNVDDFIAQLRLWIEQDVSDVNFFNKYLYECYVTTSRKLSDYGKEDC